MRQSDKSYNNMYLRHVKVNLTLPSGKSEFYPRLALIFIKEVKVNNLTFNYHLPFGGGYTTNNSSLKEVR